jgi:hypothetical protein
MILLDAVATSLSFAFRAGNEKNLVVFGLAVTITAILVVIERLTLWLLVRSSNTKSGYYNHDKIRKSLF